jgi:predicted N-formylglutamate amidohydrolase
MPVGSQPELLLGPDEPAVYAAIGTTLPGRALLVCDHAAQRIPRRLQRLGLPSEALDRHIAWDLGARALTEALSEHLRTPAFCAQYSRLVIDCNRAADAPDAMTTDGDGHRIAGNEALTAGQRAARVTAIHEPYHAALAAQVDRLQAGGPTALIAVHSYTPVFRQRARPWRVGVLSGDDRRIADPLLRDLRCAAVGPVGDNEPYSGRYPGAYTVHRHGHERGLPHVSLEIRQDELLTPGGIQRWAECLATALQPILAHYGVLA